MEQAAAPLRLTPARAVEVIDRAFRIYRDNFVTFAGLVALVTVPLTLLQDALQRSITAQSTSSYWDNTYTDTLNRLALLGMVWLLGGIIQAVIINGLITYIASENHLGRNPSIGQAFREMKGRFLPLGLGLVFAGVLLFILMVLVMFIGAICLPLFLLLPIVFYIAISLYFFIVPVLALERVPVTRGVNRALHLGKSRFWVLFFFVIAMGIITLIVNVAVQAFARFLFGEGGEMTDTLSTIVTTIMSIFTAPVLPIGLTLMYYDTRIRVEGLDLALMMVERPEPRPSDIYSPPPRGRILDSRDFGNIALLIGLFVLMMCGLYVIMLTIVQNLSIGATF